MIKFTFYINTKKFLYLEHVNAKVLYKYLWINIQNFIFWFYLQVVQEKNGTGKTLGLYYLKKNPKQTWQNVKVYCRWVIILFKRLLLLFSVTLYFTTKCLKYYCNCEEQNIFLIVLLHQVDNLRTK